LKKRITDAVHKLEEQIAIAEGDGQKDDELTKAKEALKAGQKIAEE
jgi:hypothetical protein